MRNLILSSYHSPILHLHYQRYQRKKNTGIVTWLWDYEYIACAIYVKQYTL
uniref:Uncharacterized protein n=1 Tax=Rhizophora mucronata TaxID=61149 RepID=A0A2P2LGC1_RHIMU